ncbi:hypothetical protein [Kribbella sp. VKM Ac-2568]|uniref:hypothetical protein n=1 Tax=Kribbella sp. VKM Ac-2568 TaxID=2512219 RepID=UPI001043D3D6|nr:hypothetical protein [Kribbella sp. VKM Ac-2568]
MTDLPARRPAAAHARLGVLTDGFLIALHGWWDTCSQTKRAGGVEAVELASTPPVHGGPARRRRRCVRLRGV